jgi:hypothetical protein
MQKSNNHAGLDHFGKNVALPKLSRKSGKMHTREKQRVTLCSSVPPVLKVSAACYNNDNA